MTEIIAFKVLDRNSLQVVGISHMKHATYQTEIVHKSYRQIVNARDDGDLYIVLKTLRNQFYMESPQDHSLYYTSETIIQIG